MFSRSPDRAATAFSIERRRASSERRRAPSRPVRAAVLCLVVALSACACTPELIVVLDETSAEAYGGESELRHTARRVSGVASRIELRVVENDVGPAIRAAYRDHPRSRIGIPVLRADSLQSLPADARRSVIFLGGDAESLPIADSIAEETSRETAAHVYFDEEAAIRSAAERIARLVEGKEGRIMLFADDNGEHIDLLQETLEQELGAGPADSAVAEVVPMADIASDSEARERVESFADAGGRVVVSESRERRQALMTASETHGLRFIGLFPRLVASTGERPGESSPTMRVVRPFELLLEHARIVAPGERAAVDSVLR
ncbi:MAG: hypothetical protein ACLFM0_04000 [Spirochaetales bacterium]